MNDFSIEICPLHSSNFQIYSIVPLTSLVKVKESHSTDSIYLQAIVQEEESGRIAGLPVLCPAVTTPRWWLALNSVCKAVSVLMEPTYTKTDVSLLPTVLVMSVSICKTSMYLSYGV